MAPPLNTEMAFMIIDSKYMHILSSYSLSQLSNNLQGWRQLPKSGGGGETLPHLLATSPGLPLLFLEYIMQKGKKNEERNLNTWD